MYQRVIDHAPHQRAQLLLAGAQPLGGLLFGGDVTAGDIDLPRVGGHGPGDPPPGTVTVTETVFHVHPLHTVRQLLPPGDGGRLVVGMTQLTDVQRFDFVLGLAEQGCPGGVDAGK